MANDLLLGLDLGTTGIKALLLSPSAGPIAQATVEYPIYAPFPGWSEQDPEDWWQGVGQVIRLVLAHAGTKAGDIAGLAVSGQMHGATLLDATGRVLRPAILWNDQRSGTECDVIAERIGLLSLLAWVANPALAGFTAPKILWVREHEPEVYRRIATVLLPKDYVNYRLTGVLATEVSDASGTLLFDVVHRRWSAEMLQALDIPGSLMPRVHESTDVVGRVTAEAAAFTGLLEGTPVVAGGADNACAAVGMGVIRSGQVLTSLGTSGTVVAPSAEPELDPRGRLHTFCHAVPATWYVMGVVLSAGGSLRWYRDTIAVEEVRQAVAEGCDPYDIVMRQAGEAPIGSERLIFLPYLTGERTPHGDPDARGVFFGLSPRHTRAHLARSVIEGVTYALGDSVAIMRGLGMVIESVRATGGGSRSPLWRQIQADVLEAEVWTGPENGPALGAAILAGSGVGLFPSVEVGTEQLVRLRDVTQPEPGTVRRYREYRRIFDDLYPRLQESFAALQRL